MECARIVAGVGLPGHLANPDLGESFRGIERFLPDACPRSRGSQEPAGTSTASSRSTRCRSTARCSTAKSRKLASWVEAEDADPGKYLVRLYEWLDDEVQRVFGELPPDPLHVTSSPADQKWGQGPSAAKYRPSIAFQQALVAVELDGAAEACPADHRAGLASLPDHLADALFGCQEAKVRLRRVPRLSGPVPALVRRAAEATEAVDFASAEAVGANPFSDTVAEALDPQRLRTVKCSATPARSTFAAAACWFRRTDSSQLRSAGGRAGVLEPSHLLRLTDRLTSPPTGSRTLCSEQRLRERPASSSSRLHSCSKPVRDLPEQRFGSTTREFASGPPGVPVVADRGSSHVPRHMQSALRQPDPAIEEPGRGSRFPLGLIIDDPVRAVLGNSAGTLALDGVELEWPAVLGFHLIAMVEESAENS